VPKNVVELIELASKAAGSDNKLAKLIDAHQQHVSKWRSGEKPCPPGDVALMAEVAGLDPDEWMARAVLAKYEGTPKGEKLMRALKVGRMAAEAGAEPARAALESIVEQLDDQSDQEAEAKRGILAILEAFPPEIEKLKSKQKARRSTRRG